ncbi:MAG: cytochrome P450 [Acidimicrobiales bacterium]
MAERGADSADLAHFERHYAVNDPDLADHMWDVVAHLQSTCPVAHSDAPIELGGAGRGMWVVTTYDDVFAVLQDWETFSSAHRWRLEAKAPGQMGDMPPISTDPPLQREFRRLLNPYLTPQAVVAHEPQVRRIVTELIDDFIGDGQCDLVGQLAFLHPPRMLYQVLFGIEDDAELHRTLGFLHQMSTASDSASHREALAAWNGWITEFVESRRASPRRNDVIDALLHGTVDGRPLTEAEISGAIRILILGGFYTTTDATTSTMMLLLDHPDLAQEVRRDQSLLPKLFDETLRLEAPVISQYRVCTRDVELHGRQLRQGEAVVVHLGGANRDPSQFDDPAELRTDRPRNRHLAFGAGPHRCIGSNVARLNLRVVFEEILSRLQDVRIAEGKSPRHSQASQGWGWEYVPLAFTPGQRLLS